MSVHRGVHHDSNMAGGKIRVDDVLFPHVEVCEIELTEGIGRPAPMAVT